MSEQINRFYEFGPFRLVPDERQLLRDGTPVSLPPKAFDTLLVLVQHNGHAVKKNDLIEMVWPDAIVEENNLNQYVSLLRKVLDDGVQGERYIETVRRYGYRFEANVRETQNETNAILVYKHGRTQVSLKEEQFEKAVAVSSALPRRLTLTLAVLAVAVVLSGIAITLFLMRTPSKVESAAPKLNIKSIAVLPFKPPGVANADEYLGLQMTDVLITRLSHLQQPGVRPTSAVLKYSGPTQDALVAGRELSVDAVLDGRIQRSGNRVRITVQLLSVKDGTPLWADEFDGNFSDIFNVQDLVCERVGRAVAPNLTSAEIARLGKRETENAEAYQAYLKGRYFWNKRTAVDFRKAAEYFQQAIAIDPNYAQAYVGLTDCYSFLGDGASARRYLERALALDDTLADAHATLAFVYKFCGGWDWDGAEKEFKRSIELNPSYAPAHHWYAYDLAAMGRLDEAVREIKQAHQLDPLSVVINTDVGEILYFARRYDEAIAAYRGSLEMDPNFPVAHCLLGYAYEQEGMYAEAIAEYQKWQALAKGSDHPEAAGPLGRTYALLGRYDEAIRILDELKQRKEKSAQAGKLYIPFNVALIYAALGDKDKAFEWLEKAFAHHDYDMIYATMDPRSDSLRSDPRFQDLLRRMKLTS
jgi:DNA-binding winged helix-turn-helix (wHTH) protein/TolB-like protein/tetratricopeptide (TPR) repeat protein